MLKHELDSAEKALTAAIEDILNPSIRELITYFDINKKMYPHLSYMTRYRDYRRLLDKLVVGNQLLRLKSTSNGYNLRYSKKTDSKKRLYISTIDLPDKILSYAFRFCNAKNRKKVERIRYKEKEIAKTELIRIEKKVYCILEDNFFVGVCKKGKFSLPGIHRNSLSEYEIISKSSYYEGRILKIHGLIY